MRVWAVKGEEKLPVYVTHWWPGRQYKYPSYTEMMKKRFKGKSYGTVATIPDFFKVNKVTIYGRYVIAIDDGPITGLAKCSKQDQPSRYLGRLIALGQLQRQIEEFGWRIVGE